MAESPDMPPTTSMVQSSEFVRLSGREEEVLSMAASGYLDKQIGAELGLSLNTLRTYWSRIRSKVGEAPRTALAAAYVEQSLADARVQEPLEEFWDWEIDMSLRTIRRVSSRILPGGIPSGVDVPLDEIFALFHPDDEPRMRALIDDLETTGIEAFHYVARMITREGMLLGSAFIHVERDALGVPLRLFGRRVPSLDLRPPSINNIAIGFWKLDLRTQALWMNEQCREIFRIPPLIEPKMEDLLCRIDPDYIDQARNCVRDVLSLGVDHKRSTYRLRFEDGAQMWLACDVDVEKDDKGPACAVGTVMAFEWILHYSRLACNP